MKTRQGPPVLGGRSVGLALFAILMVLVAPLSAADLDNAGDEFIMAFLPNFQGGTAVELHITADDTTDVYVEFPMNAPTFYDTVTAIPGEIVTVSLPTAAANIWNVGTVTPDNTVRAHADREFVCYQINREPFTSDAALALPVDVMNRNYIVITHRGATHGSDAGEFAVVARENNSVVTITPTNDLAGGYTAGTPFDITLNRGEAFLAQSSSLTNDAADLTGTLIESSKPIAMVNGNRCTNIPITTTACDHVFEVAQPIQSWGKRIYSTDLPQRDGGSMFRVVAAADNTVLSLDGTVIDTLDRGEMYEASFLTGHHVWEGSNGIFVVQFMTSQNNPQAISGDPAMGNLAPSEQYLKEYTFATPGIGQFQTHYLTVIAHVADVFDGTIFLDGSAIPSGEFSQIPATNYWAASVQIGEGSHTTRSVDSAHGILITGYNNFDSYLYPGGALFVPIQSITDTIAPVCVVTEEECGASVTATDDHADAAGIFVVRLDNGSENLTLTTDPFDQGTTLVTYRVDVTDSTLPASGSVTVIDGEGNSCTQNFEFDCTGGGDGGITPTYAWINVYCGQPTLDGEPLASTDTIKAYDPNGVLCGMEVVGDDLKYGLMPIYRDDEFTLEDEGAEPGDEITFWINDQQVVTDPVIVWTENGDSYELCVFSTEVCKTIELKSGWNLISWNVQYEDELTALLAEHEGCYSVVLGFNGEGQTFVPGLERFATLTDVDFYNGYWIKVICPFSLEICGPPIEPSMSIPVDIGWNLVSYWPEDPLPIETAFNSIWSSLEVALGYDAGALVFVPDSNGFNTLDTLRECFGYWAKVNDAGVLAYPGFGDGIEVRSHSPGLALSDLPYRPTRRWVSVYGENLTVDGRAIENNTPIEVVSESGAVIGQGVYQGGILKFTSAYGSDASVDGTRDYAKEGESFRLSINGTPLYPELTWSEHGALIEMSALSTSPYGAVVPGSFALHQNYPNPFNPTTTISFNLPQAGQVELAVYNLLGQQIRTLVSGDLAAGSHTVEWNGRSDNGEAVSTGIYFYRLTAGDLSETRKMMLLK